ncbi:hypothetical protein D3C81_1011190 [compost metagenome]
MTLGPRLEVLGQQRSTIETHAAGIGHVRHQPQAGTGQAIKRLQQAIDACQIGLLAGLHQTMRQTEHRGLSGWPVLQRSAAPSPFGKGRLGEGMGVQFFGAGQKLGHEQDSKAGLGVV